MTTELATRENGAGGALALWDREQTEVIKTLICPGASDPELKLFGQVCQKTGLDPFSRQIYGIMRSQRQQVHGEWKTVEKLSIQTSIDGFRLIAERSGKYGGQLGPQWCGEDGRWRDVWLAREYPSAARVGVIRTDWQEPLWAVARWDSYVQTYKPRNSDKEVVGNMWQRMPDVMLAKVAESLALRRAFPAELSGLYTSEEMHQADRERAHEDLPQFQQAMERATVVQSSSAPIRPEDDRPFDAGTGAGATTPARSAGSATSSDPDTSATSAPADEKNRATFEASWEKGIARATAIGAVPDDKPGEQATKAELRKALNDLKEIIDAREKLTAIFTSRQDEARAAGADTADVDLTKATDQELHEMIATLDEILSAVPDTEAF